MKIITDKIDTDPDHTLSSIDLINLNKFIINKFNLRIKVYRLSNQTPHTQEPEIPVCFSDYSSRLNICSRGLDWEYIVKEVFVEVIQRTNKNLKAGFGNKLSKKSRSRIDDMLPSLYTEFENQYYQN